MNKALPNYIRPMRWLVTVLLSLFIWIFFSIFYRHHLHYQEQIQLFLTTTNHFTEHLTRPGGLAIYIGEFFTQFFYDSFAGAFVIVLLLLLLQILVSDASRQPTHKPVYTLLTWLPSVVYFLLLLNEDITLSGLVALNLSLLFLSIHNRIRTPGLRILFGLLATPVLYWLVGAAAIIFPALCILTEWSRKQHRMNKTMLYIYTITAPLIFILTIPAAMLLHPQFPLEAYLIAGDYYRFTAVYRYSFYLLFGLVIAIPEIIRLLPGKLWNIIITLGLQLILLLGTTALGIYYLADFRKEEVMAYDHFARMKKWNSILRMADKQQPVGPLTVSTLNLALAKTGMMPQYIFHYYQNGTEGLVPTFTKQYTSGVMLSEIYYHLGMINSAQHFAFEAMEVIPDYRKSVRCIKRLAETNLINGQYQVAAKYLYMLKHTLFYRKWATETLGYLDNEERINNHPEWGELRKYRPWRNFLFSEKEHDMMFGLVYQDNPVNRLAYEYLLAHTLLKKDLKNFHAYYQLEAGKNTNERLPESFQEALAYIWSLTEYNPAYRPAGIEERIIKRLEAYRKVYTAFPDAREALRLDFENTYWYYLHYR